MTAFGRCISCGVTCIDAQAWRVHELEFHKPHDEFVCLFCGKAMQRDVFRWHPCAADVFTASRHPSKGGVA